MLDENAESKFSKEIKTKLGLRRDLTDFDKFEALWMMNEELIGKVEELKGLK